MPYQRRSIWLYPAGDLVRSDPPSEQNTQPSWWLRVWRAIEPRAALSDAGRALFDERRVQVQAAHLKWVLPSLLVIHLASAAYFTGLPRVDESSALWLDTLTKLHGVAAAFAAIVLAAVTATVRELRNSTWRLALFEALLRFYPLFGALISANAQRSHKGYGFYLLASLASAIAIQDARGAFALNMVAASLLSFAIANTQPDPALRGAAIVTVFGAGLLSFLWSRITSHLLAAVVRTELTQNAARENLERELAEQLAASNEHVREIGRLNQQLDVVVQRRTKELSLALAKLALGAQGRRTITPGTIVGARFVVDAPLNVGRSVWLADDKLTDGRVVLRVAQATSAAELDEFHRMLGTVDVFSSIRDAVFVRTVHIDLTEDGVLVQAMEYVPGVTIEAWLAQQGPLPSPIVARMGALVASGLAAAHNAGLLHGSLSPASVMLSGFSPGVRMLGFGAIRSSQSSVRNETAILSGVDPAYVSPEFVADGTIGVSSDVYAAGLVMYRALAGRAPFDRTTGAGWLKAHESDEPKPLSSLVRNVSPALAEIVMRCLAKKPEHRPTARQLADELERLANTLSAGGVDEYVRNTQSETSGALVSAHVGMGV